MGRATNGQRMVRKNQIKTGVPRPPERSDCRDGPRQSLHKSGFLSPEKLKQALLLRAEHLGFASARITSADAIPEAAPHLRQWLSAHYHGSMAWMAETEERRNAPRSLWPEVRSIIMLGMNYGPSENPLSHLDQKERASISVYAQSRDYHDVIKGKLKELAGFIAVRGGGDVKVFVDTAPVMEKPLAQAAGIGWQGKHTVLVSREFGNWLFLGAIFTTLDLPLDEPEKDHCGSCRRCLDICPTQALPAAGQLDSRRCISYLTIEYKGHIPEEFRRPMGNRIFGCDDCLAICPWNKFAHIGTEAKLAQRQELSGPFLSELLSLDEVTFRSHFSGTPIRRLGRDRFIRNVLIAAGNANDHALLPQIKALLEDQSPLVRAMAVWALAQQAPAPDFNILKSLYTTSETDKDVRNEWLSNGP